MTYIEIVKAIEKLDARLDDYYRVYRNFRDELSRLDAEIMSLNKRKWLLESKLIRVTKCPTYKPKAPSQRSPKDLTDVDLAKLSADEISTILRQMKEQDAKRKALLEEM